MCSGGTRKWWHTFKKPIFGAVVKATKKFPWRTRALIPVPLECESSALPFELVPLSSVGRFCRYTILKRFSVQGFPLGPLAYGIRSADLETTNLHPVNVRIQLHLSSRLRALKSPIFLPKPHVRMAERSKAPDSRVELFLTGVFWSTNVGVGSNPTSDKCFQISKKNDRYVQYPRKSRKSRKGSSL